MKFYYIFSILLLVGCDKDGNNSSVKTNEDGIIEYIPPLWEKPHIEDGDWRNAAPTIFGNWSFDGKVLAKYRHLDTSLSLQCVDAATGDVCWEWKDMYNTETESTNGRYYMLKDNILHWKTGKRQYWLDLSDGSTIKKYNGSQGFTFKMETHGDTYFNIATNYDLYEGLGIGCVFQGDFYDESPAIVLEPLVDLNQTLNDRAADITSAIPVMSGADTLLIVGWQQVFPNWEFQSYLGLYNLSQKQWIYNSKPLCEIGRKGVLYHPFTKYGNTVITNVGKSLICYNYLTGAKVWEQIFNHDFVFSGFEISDDILVANCEDKTLYGINPATGQILWRGTGAGTSSLLKDRILNGVVYFKGGSSGYFHAVDIQTGSTLWKLDPYLYEESNAFWALGDVRVAQDPITDKGYIVISNALNTYCFEAVR